MDADGISKTSATDSPEKQMRDEAMRLDARLRRADIPGRMKRRFHQCLLLLAIVALIPPAFVALPMLMAIIWSGVITGFQDGEAEGVVLFASALMLTVSLSYLGVQLFFRLYAGFLPRIRTRIVRYYAAITFCGLPVFLGAVHEAGQIEVPIHASLVILGITGMYLAPLLIAIFMRPERISAAEREKMVTEDDRLAA
jgi:hypothetical protein